MHKESVTEIQGCELKTYKRHSGIRKMAPKWRPRAECREHTRNVRSVIAIAKAETIQEWYDKLNTKNGAREV